MFIDDDGRHCPSIGGQITISIFLTFFITAVIFLVVGKIRFRTKYGHLLTNANRQINYEETVSDDEI